MTQQQGPAMIEADRLSKYYGNFAAIENVSFEVRRGECLGLIGRNGAGKTIILLLTALGMMLWLTSTGSIRPLMKITDYQGKPNLNM